jgi:hypothetical protein
MAGDRDPLVVRDYTRGFRFPEVIGKLGRWRPIWGIATMPQYLLGVGSFFVLLRTWGVWAGLSSRLLGHLNPTLPTALNVLVLLGVPVGLFAAAGRHTQVDGRPPTSAVLTLAVHLASSLLGRSGGQGVDRRHTRLHGTWVWVRRLEGDG